MPRSSVELEAFTKAFDVQSGNKLYLSATSINIPRYVSNGYVLLRPDIVYTTGYPGEAAEKCVIPAVNTVVAAGYIDPKRIGIQGHSWGGYQITHLITRTNLFAAVQAGASVSNMISGPMGAGDRVHLGAGAARQGRLHVQL